MSVASGPPRPRGRLERLDPLIMWAGHNALYLTALWIAAGLANIATGWRIGPLGYLADVTVFTAIAAVSCDLLRHQQALCERCITQSPTLNPDAALRRWKWALWWNHQRVLRILPPLLILAWIFGGPAIGLTRAGNNFGERPWELAVDGLMLTTIGVLGLVTAQHRRLYPWCPWCKWGGGGDGAPEPSPAPQHPAAKS